MHSMFIRLPFDPSRSLYQSKSHRSFFQYVRIHLLTDSSDQFHISKYKILPNFLVANFIPTRKGSLLLVHNGFAFRLKNKLAYGKKQWYCTSRTKTGCHVDVTTEVHRKGNMIRRVRNVHNHPAPGFYRRNDGSFKVV